MVFVVGPCASGKRTYALSCGYSADDFLDSGSLLERCDENQGHSLIRDLEASDCSVVIDAHKLACQVEDIHELANVLSQKAMVICTEVGAGVVPIDKGDRVFRENAGRLGVQLANHAQKVVRMVCGIPVVIKE